jgi:hypothetical protein
MVRRNILTLPEPVSLKSAGAVAEKAYLNEDGEAWKTNPIDSKMLGDASIVWNWNDGGDGTWSTTYFNSVIKKPSSNTVVGDILCPKYVAVTNEETYSHTKIGISVAISGKIRIYDPSLDSSSNLHTLLADVPFTYALATPDADTPLTPILDNLISTEAGGTIESILTNPVDDSMTLGYINL